MMIDPATNSPAFEPKASPRRGHVESYFIKLNSPDGARAIWVRYTLFAEVGTVTRAECWAVVFTRGGRPRALKRSFPLDHKAMLLAPFRIVFDGCAFDGEHSTGSITNARENLEWSFTLTSQVPSLRPFPYGWMYTAPVPETKLVSPNPDAIATGSFTIDGVRTDVTGWRGMQGHNWGTRHTHRYAWCQADGFEGDETVVFEGLSGRLLKGGVELPWMTLAFLWIDGQWLRFDRPRTIANATAEASVMHWRFETSADGYRLQGEATAQPEETAGLHYANPRGPVTYCLNSKLATLTLTLSGPSGERAFKTNKAALELGWPTADHGIEMLA